MHRAEQAIEDRRPRYDPDPTEAERVTQAFLQACTSGDVQGLLGLLADDVVVYSDGGGKATAALRAGARRIAPRDSLWV